MNVSRAHLLAALRFLDGPDGGGSGGTPPGGTDPQGTGGAGGTPPAGDKGSGDDEGEDDPDADEDPADKGDRQARRDENTRAKLKEAEAARETLAAKVEKLQRAEVLRMAGNTLAEPEDLLAVGGHELAEFLDEDGEVDPGAVAAALDILANTRPGLLKGARPPRRGGHPDWGHSRSNVDGIGGEGPTWGEALIRREGSGRR